MNVRKFSVVLLKSFDMVAGEVYSGVQEVVSGEACYKYDVRLGGVSDVALALCNGFDAYIDRCDANGVKPENIVSMVITEVTGA